MRHFLITAVFSMFLPISAQLCMDRAGFAVGYRQDNLDWNFAGPNNHPTVLSELEWDHLQSAEVSASIDLSLHSLCFRAGADYGRVFSGSQRDSDYEGDHRTLEFSRSRATSDKGELFDVSCGIGRRFHYGAFTCTPFAGYSLNEQHLRDRRGVILINTSCPRAIGSLHGLHSNYRAKWSGPWIGLDGRYQVTDRISCSSFLEYHWPQYRGTGHWNLRHFFFKDFQQKANGNGLIATLSGEYTLEPRWSFGLLGIYRKFTTDRGRDRKFILLRLKRTDGTEFEAPVSFDSRLNRVQWTSFGIKIYGSYTF